MTDSGFNLFYLPRYKGVLVEQVDNALRIIFPQRVDGRRGVLTGFAPPPRTITTDRFDPSTERLPANERMALQGDPSYGLADQGLYASDVWGGKVGAVANDLTLSSAGKLKIAVAATLEALTTMGGLFAKLETIAAKLAREHATLYATPVADTAAAVVDTSLWQWYFKLSAADRVKSMTAGPDRPVNPRFLLAMARLVSPLPLEKVEQDRINAAWVAQVATNSPEAVATLALAEEANQWAMGLLRHLGQLMADPNTSGTAGSIDGFQIYQTLRAVNGTGLLNYSAQQVAMHERRIASIAA